MNRTGKRKGIVRLIAGLLALIGIVSLAGCGGESKKAGPEVGKWHAAVQLSDISGSMSEEDKATLAMLGGSTMFEVDVEFSEDGTFSYVMNIDKLKESVSNSFSSLLGLFMDIDVSVFVEHIVEAALQEALPGVQQSYAGNYTTGEDGTITAADGSAGNLYFQVKGGLLIQIDGSGNEVMKFSKAE